MKSLVVILSLIAAPVLAQPPADSLRARMPASPETLSRIVRLPEVVVSTARADDRIPVAKSVLDREALQQRNRGQDTPMALATLPGVYAYSDAGNGIGYSYLSIRGFPQRRITVLINGVPLNDPESHEVYWIDHPDLLASTTELQLQRGVGSALYGAASLGGSVNLETSPFGTHPAVTATLGYGSYRTRRASLEMDSGPLAGGWNLYGRYSRIETDGYREQSWSRLWSYYLSARRILARHSLRFDLFGGPETTHLAYKGVPAPYLDGAITGNADRDRRANLLAYPGEADHFFEPHYELVHTWSPHAGLDFAQTLFWFDGEGYYDEQRLDSLGAYRLTPWAADTTLYSAAYFQDAYGQTARDAQGHPLLLQTDLVRRRFIRNHHYGWVPRLAVTHAGGTLIVGGELRAHDGHHLGTVISGSALPPGTEPDHPYYDYHPRTLTGGLFVREEWRAASTVTVTADLGWRHQSYRMRDDRYGGVRFDQSYDFAQPRLGLVVMPRPDLNLFAAWSHARREPRFLDLFNPEAAGSLPNYRTRDATTNNYADPYSRPEKVNDYELGASWRGHRASAGANLFRMDVRDELVDFQFNSDLAEYVTTNAARSLHQGVELSAAAAGTLARGARITLDANATFSDNHFVRFQEQVDPTTVISHDGKALGFFPAVSANARARLEWRGASLGAQVQRVGRIYLDNSEDPGASIAPRAALDLSAGYRASLAEGRWFEAELSMFNALDRRYATGGYFDYDDTGSYVPHYVVAARRNALAQVRVGF
jgi:iron complex outermembrane receptor protein